MGRRGRIFVGGVGDLGDLGWVDGAGLRALGGLSWGLENARR